MAHEESRVGTVVGGKVVDPALTGGILYDGHADRARAAAIAQASTNKAAMAELLAVLQWARDGRHSYSAEAWSTFLNLVKDTD
jgi:hypothetical protein